MIYLFLLVSCIVFIELFQALRLKREALLLIMRSREAIEIIASSEIEDDQKEIFMRRASVEMFKATALLIIKFVLIVLALFLIYWLTIFALPELEAPILTSLVSPIVILGLTLVAAFYVWIRNVILK